MLICDIISDLEVLANTEGISIEELLPISQQLNFDVVQKLDLSYNLLTSLNLPDCRNLTFLDVSNNRYFFHNILTNLRYYIIVLILMQIKFL